MDRLCAKNGESRTFGQIDIYHHKILIIEWRRQCTVTKYRKPTSFLFSMVNKVFCRGNNQKVLTYAIEKVKHQTKPEIDFVNDNELYLPKRELFVDTQLVKIIQSAMPKKTVIYRRHDSRERGLFLE